MFGLRISSILSASALLLIALLTGCVAPQATLLTDKPLQRYKRVYLATANPDPRQVHSRIATRLRSLGFDVRAIGTNAAEIGGQGTGFVINTNGAVLTCAHLFGTNEAATLWIGGKRFEADVIGSDTNSDLAVLQLRPGSGSNAVFKPLTLSTEPLKLGQPVYTLGFPLSDMLGKSPRLSHGLVSSTVGLDDNPKQYQVSVAIQSGNSGGPLLSERGEVVGMITGTLNPMNVLLRTGGNLPQNVNFASTAAAVAEFARSNNVPLQLQSGDTYPFEQIQGSVALIRAGIIPEGEEDLPELACSYSYVSIWDMWYRFRVFHVVFFDVKTGKPVLRVGQYRENPFTSEDAVMDRTFAEVKAKFGLTSPATK